MGSRFIIAGRVYAANPDDAHELILQKISQRGFEPVGPVNLWAVPVQTQTDIWYEWRSEVRNIGTEKTES